RCCRHAERRHCALRDGGLLRNIGSILRQLHHDRLLAHPTHWRALMTERTYPAVLSFVGGEQITALSASAAPAAIPTNASWATIKPRTAGIYLRLNAGTASSADMYIPADTAVDVTTKLSDLRILQQAAGAIVDIWYWG